MFCHFIKKANLRVANVYGSHVIKLGNYISVARECCCIWTISVLMPNVQIKIAPSRLISVNSADHWKRVMHMLFIVDRPFTRFVRCRLNINRLINVSCRVVATLFSFAIFNEPKKPSGAPNDNFRKIVCSEDDLRSRIFWKISCLPASPRIFELQKNRIIAHF